MWLYIRLDHATSAEEHISRSISGSVINTLIISNTEVAVVEVHGQLGTNMSHITYCKSHATI